MELLSDVQSVTPYDKYSARLYFLNAWRKFVQKIKKKKGDEQDCNVNSDFVGWNLFEFSFRTKLLHVYIYMSDLLIMVTILSK